MKKAAPEKESGLKVMHGHSIKTNDTWAGAPVAHARRRMYREPVAANSVTGFGDPSKSRRTRRPSNPKAGAFFVPPLLSYGSCARDTFGYAGCQLSRFANLRTAATQNRLATISGSSSNQGAMPMNRIRTIRANAHRRMAIAALHADTSLKTRLTRYQQHMTKARALEALGGVE